MCPRAPTGASSWGSEGFADVAARTAGGRHHRRRQNVVTIGTARKFWRFYSTPALAQGFRFQEPTRSNLRASLSDNDDGRLGPRHRLENGPRAIAAARPGRK